MSGFNTSIKHLEFNSLLVPINDHLAGLRRCDRTGPERVRAGPVRGTGFPDIV
jgi:hypothetical protein